MRGMCTVVMTTLFIMGACGYRFHVLGPSHLPVSRQYNACAFTQKIVKMCHMLRAHNHTVFLYGAEGTDRDLATHWIQTHTLADIRRDFGDADYSGPHAIGYDWQGHGKGFRHDFETPRPCTRQFYDATIEAIRRVQRDDDFVLATLGTHHRPITDALNLTLVAEPGIGYRGSYARFRAFESHYIQYFTYGSQNPGKGLNGDWYHRVIPNYYDTRDFPFRNVATMPPYYLFLGRLIARKGLGVAIETSRRLGLRLVIAGQGHQGWFPGNRTLFDQSGNAYTLTPHMQFVGYANATYRAQLMQGATAVFTPTLFLEPFCGVAVEAQLCGTPVITSAFGAFVDTVQHGVTGFRCNTLADFMTAAILVTRLNRTYIHTRAVDMFSMPNVALQYERWWHDLYDVYKSVETQGQHAAWNRMPNWYDAYVKRYLTPTPVQVPARVGPAPTPMPPHKRKNKGSGGVTITTPRKTKEEL